MAAPLTEKFDNINLLRAFAALAVVVYHVIEHGHWTQYPTQGPLVVFRIGWIGVDVFFAISGFVITYSSLLLYRGAPHAFASRYWTRRIARIVPLYVLTIAVWVGFQSPSYFSQPAREWSFQLATHALFIHNWFSSTNGSIDGVNWSLGVEMQFYALVALLIRWLDRTPGWRIWLWCASIAVAWRACMFWLNAGDSWRLFMATTQLPGTLDEFGAGIFLAKWVLDGKAGVPAPRITWTLAAVATTWIAMALYWPRAGYWDNVGMVMFWRCAFAISLLCVLAASISLPQVLAYKWLRPIDHLGEVSYGIYLWHLFAVQYAIYAMGYGGVQALLWVLGLTLVAAGLSWRYFEKPLMKVARR